MGVNRDKPDIWDADIARSVDEYNSWFQRFAPDTYRQARKTTEETVFEALSALDDLLEVTDGKLKESPSLIRTLRMATCPPLAVDRVVGLAGVSRNLVLKMEKNKLPQRMAAATLDRDLGRILRMLDQLYDRDIFVWIDDRRKPTKKERDRAATVVADRLCGSLANPIIRNAQEERQLSKITEWLQRRDYREASSGTKHNEMDPGTYGLQSNVVAKQDDSDRTVNIPIDVVVMPKRAKRGDFPILVEAKSAGDFTNVNKRRKEEATKINQLRDTYGMNLTFVLFLCGYFDSGYLSYEAAEGIDWVWEHRIDDLEEFEL